MRKKQKIGGATSEASFLEDFADEFFTCSYFFKCLGECAMEEGGDLASTERCAKSKDLVESEVEASRAAHDFPGYFVSWRGTISDKSQ